VKYKQKIPTKNTNKPPTTMFSRALVVLAAVSGSIALTPQGFQPGSQTDLIVAYGNVGALNGAVIARDGKSANDTTNIL
jgi:hypothetical protein